MKIPSIIVKKCLQYIQKISLVNQQSNPQDFSNFIYISISSYPNYRLQQFPIGLYHNECLNKQRLDQRADLPSFIHFQLMKFVIVCLKSKNIFVNRRKRIKVQNMNASRIEMLDNIFGIKIFNSFSIRLTFAKSEAAIK